MKHNLRSKANRKKANAVLGLPDLEYAKAAVLNSLTSLDAQRKSCAEAAEASTAIVPKRQVP
jgi:hypothetical protein